MKVGTVGAHMAGAAVVVGMLFGGMLYGGWNSPASGLPTAAGVQQVSAETVAGTTRQQGQLQTVTLNVDGMWCPSCGYIVYEVLMATPGVTIAVVQLGRAVVTFDPRQAALADVIAATGKYGYPAELVSG